MMITLKHSSNKNDFFWLKLQFICIHSDDMVSCCMNHEVSYKETLLYQFKAVLANKAI